MATAIDVRAQWPGDVLERKRQADFLSSFLLQKYKDAERREGSGAICFALDGPWGCGKTFFITRWMQDLENAQHPVILFDAWKNDLLEEPLVGLLAALRDGMARLVDLVPMADRAKDKAIELRKKVFSHAGRAVVPVSAVIAKGLVKKISGINLDDLFASARGEDSPSSTSTDSASTEAPDKERLTTELIDRYFEVSLKQHTTQLQAIEELKQSIGKLLEHIKSHRERTSLPVFIFIDELDRCRPNYAIKLLEGLKHLLDVRGLCFCVSTNFTQLRECIRGVYGNGFDSHRYLKRFFAFEYSLPEPSDSAYAKLLVATSRFNGMTDIVCDPSFDDIAEADPGAAIAETFCGVACAFSLDLRSQKQVFDAAEAATAGLADEALHVGYLFILTALRHSDPQVFDNAQPERSSEEYSQMLHDLLQKNATQGNGDKADERRRAIDKVVELFSHYRQLERTDLKEIGPLIKTQSAYPPWILDALHLERPGAYNTEDILPPSIRHYAELIRSAGQIQTDRAVDAP